MKNLFLVLIFCLTAASTHAQISFDQAFPTNNYTGVGLARLQINGNKYVQFDQASSTIYIYNLNHTIFKSITIPSTIPAYIYPEVEYISDSLFNSDNLIEYAFMCEVNSVPKFYVFNETGSQLLFVDSVYLGQTSFYIKSNFVITDPVYFDGLHTKLRLSTAMYSSSTSRDLIFTLPGAIPCLPCSGSGMGTITGMNSYYGNKNPNAVFYPNPVKDQLKLKYTLPKNAQMAIIKIQDVQGKMVDEVKVTNTFDFIYLPSNYNNGLYFYSLIVDGTVIKTEKIILDK